MQLYSFGSRSQSKLDTVDPQLQEVMHLAISWGLIDLTVIQGVRGKEEQNEYFANQRSRVQWPNSKHNAVGPKELARAVDVAPCVNGAVSWKKEHCIFAAGVILAAAKILNVPMRWGGNWDRDGEPVTDQQFQDLVHYEMV